MLVMLAAGLTFVAATAQQPQPNVKVAQGTLAGKWILNKSQEAFLGIPYAAPPVGPLRWKAPAPPVPWQGSRDATTFAPRCQQNHIWNDYIFPDAGPSEDCLYLNVYATAAAKASDRLPVMFWIHGGGFVAGSGSEARYSNSALISKGVILVTINYRLGVFGFLAMEDLAKENDGHAGNYGLMDMVAALRWVKANIAAFGGDPTNVTIFGESAGSFAVNALTVAPEAHGLFAKAIGESGAFFGDTLPMLPAASMYTPNRQWAAKLGANTLADLRALSPETLLASTQKLPLSAFDPVTDGQFIPESIPDAYAAGHQAHIPEIIGWNHDERTGTLSKGMTSAKWKAYAAERYGPDADAFLTAFPGNTDAEAIRSADDLSTAGFIAMGAWRWAEAQTQTGQAPVYRYRFDRVAPPEANHPEGKYAFHSDELEYVFGTLDTRHGAVWQSADRRLSQQMVGYWTNFARTGNPNGPNLPPWPSYDKQKEVLYLNDTITSAPDPTRAEFDFLNKHPGSH